MAVPQDFSLKIEFNYDATNNVLLANSIGLTPCGNSFSIAFKGGELANTLQLWSATPEVTTETSYDPPCHYIEDMVYSMFDISCSDGNYGDIFVNIDSQANAFVLERANRVFSTDFLSFEADILSNNANYFQNVKLITSKTNPFIEFIGVKNSNFDIEVFFVLGEKIIAKIPYHKNSVSLDIFSSGLYFIKLSNLNKEYKTFKFVN